jgi:Fe-S-cluster containining protein
MTAVDQLCPNCGLCCDSTLFADVELRAGDDPKRLKKLGLTIFKKSKEEEHEHEEEKELRKGGRSKPAFAQPCACFDGKFCGIYEDRPKRCRLFECGLLKRVQAEEMSAAAALKKISTAKALAAKVRELLHSLGQPHEKLALTKCYTQAMSEPIDLADESGSAERRGELMLAVNDLMHVLQRDFLK